MRYLIVSYVSMILCVPLALTFSLLFSPQIFSSSAQSLVSQLLPLSLGHGTLNLSFQFTPVGCDKEAFFGTDNRRRDCYKQCAQFSDTICLFAILIRCTSRYTIRFLEHTWPLLGTYHFLTRLYEAGCIILQFDCVSDLMCKISECSGPTYL
jgi:hypothetical protein